MKLELAPKKATRLISHGPVALITTVNHVGKWNVAPVTWLTPISLDPPLVIIGISPGCYTYELIQESHEFAINIPDAQLLEEVHYCGSVSGREIDKFQEMGLIPLTASKIRPPLIRQCIGHLECQVISSAPLGDHTLFVGRIVAACVEDELFDGYWKTEEPAAKTLHHLGGEYYVSPGRRFKPSAP